MTHEQIKDGLSQAQEKYHHQRNKRNLDTLNTYKRAYNVSLINITINKYKKP